MIYILIRVISLLIVFVICILYRRYITFCIIYTIPIPISMHILYRNLVPIINVILRMQISHQV